MEIWKEYFWPSKENAKCQASFENKIIMMLQLFSTPQTKSSKSFQEKVRYLSLSLCLFDYFSFFFFSFIIPFLYVSSSLPLSFLLYPTFSFTIPLFVSLYIYLSVYTLLCISFSIILTISFFLKFSFPISLSLFTNVYLSFSISLSLRKTFVSDSSSAIIRNRLKVKWMELFNTLFPKTKLPIISRS